MKAVSCHVLTIFPAAGADSSVVGQSAHGEANVPVTASQCHASRCYGEAVIPRAATLLAANLGFFAARKQLARRRFALLRQEDYALDTMQSKLSYLLPAGQTVSGYLRGRRSSVLPLCERKIQQYRRLAEAEQERSQLTAEDRFEPHDLDIWLLQDLRQQLQSYPIVRAELVKKTLRFFPEQPLYILLVSSEPLEAEAPLPQPEPTLETQIAQELCFGRELLVCLTERTEPTLVGRIQAVSQGNLLN